MLVLSRAFHWKCMEIRVNWKLLIKFWTPESMGTAKFNARIWYLHFFIMIRRLDRGEHYRESSLCIPMYIHTHIAHSIFTE